MAWFQRDHTGRELLVAERRFLADLEALLEELRPAQLDEHETALTAEARHCLILLLPHRALGGVSIVVWLFSERAAVTWAQVANLGCCHDSLDLGVHVDGFRFAKADSDFGPVLRCIRAQFGAPITLRQHDSQRAEVMVRDNKGDLRKVGELGPALGHLQRLARRDAAQESIVRFTDQTPPPVSESSHVDDWFGASQ